MSKMVINLSSTSNKIDMKVQKLNDVYIRAA